MSDALWRKSGCNLAKFETIKDPVLRNWDGLSLFLTPEYLGDSLDHPILKAVGGRDHWHTMRLQLSGPWISKNRIALCTNSQMKETIAHQVIDLLESRGQWLTWLSVNPLDYDLALELTKKDAPVN